VTFTALIENANAPMDVTFTGILIEVIEVVLKPEDPIVCKVLGNKTDVTKDLV
jgi:hypothetical protein